MYLCKKKAHVAPSDGLYLTERWSHWTASTCQQSRTGTWWRWPCGWLSWQWQNGHWGSSRPQQDWRAVVRVPSLIRSGSGTRPGGRPWRGWRTCCCSESEWRQKSQFHSVFHKYYSDSAIFLVSGDSLSWWWSFVCGQTQTWFPHNRWGSSHCSSPHSHSLAKLCKRGCL